MQTAFLVLIGIVFVITIVFGILIWRQLIKFEKKALAAKKRQAELIAQMEKQGPKTE